MPADLPEIRQSSSFSQLPEPPLVQQRDPVALLAQPFDLHQFDAAIFACRLKGVGPSSDNDGGLRRRSAVDNGAGALRGPDRLAALPAQDAGECEVDALQRP